MSLGKPSTGAFPLEQSLKTESVQLSGQVPAPNGKKAAGPMLVILCSVLAVVHWATGSEMGVRWEPGSFMMSSPVSSPARGLGAALKIV